MTEEEKRTPSTLSELLEIAGAIYNMHGNRPADNILPLIEIEKYRADCVLDFISQNFSQGICASFFQDQGPRLWGVWKKLNGHAGHFVSILGVEYRNKLCDWMAGEVASPDFFKEGKTPVLKRDILHAPPPLPETRGKQGIRRFAQLAHAYYGGAPPVEAPSSRQPIRGMKHLSMIYQGGN